MKELDKPMYFTASSEIMETARILRKNMTSYECVLWERLKQNRIKGFKFRRQHPIDRFIADFYCHAARLVVEIDGEIHLTQKEYDIGRTAQMEKYGIKVLRFDNFDVINRIEDVINEIENEILKRVNGDLI